MLRLHSVLPTGTVLMITNKAQMLRVIKDAASAHYLTREEKFRVFCNVCDNMLKEGKISSANHARWTMMW